MTKKSASLKPSEATQEPQEAKTTEPEPTRSEEGATLNVVGGLPRFNFNARPAIDESEAGVDPTPLRPSYESLLAEGTGSGADKLRRAQKLRAELDEFNANLRDDPRYTESHKYELAQAKHEKVAPQIAQLESEAHQELLKSAETRERQSIPVPEGEGLRTKDTNKLLLTAHERNRIEGLIDHLGKGEAPPGWSHDPTDILKRVYAEALDEGGPGGGATVRAVVQLASKYGVEIDEVVDAHRKPHHHEALADAERKFMQSQLASRYVASPPFKKGATRKDVGTYGSSTKGFIPSGASDSSAGMSIGSKRKQRHW